MNAPQVSDTVGDVVARCPALARVFEEKGLDSQAFLATLEESVLAPAGESVVDATAMSLTELVDHIEQTHHAYLHSEFPRLDKITEKSEERHIEL